MSGMAVACQFRRRPHAKRWRRARLQKRAARLGTYARCGCMGVAQKDGRIHEQSINLVDSTGEENGTAAGGGWPTSAVHALP